VSLSLFIWFAERGTDEIRHFSHSQPPPLVNLCQIDVPTLPLEAARGNFFFFSLLYCSVRVTGPI